MNPVLVAGLQVLFAVWAVGSLLFLWAAVDIREKPHMKAIPGWKFWGGTLVWPYFFIRRWWYDRKWQKILNKIDALRGEVCQLPEKNREMFNAILNHVEQEAKDGMK